MPAVHEPRFAGLFLFGPLGSVVKKHFIALDCRRTMGPVSDGVLELFAHLDAAFGLPSEHDVASVGLGGRASLGSALPSDGPTRQQRDPEGPVLGVAQARL